MCHPIVIFFFGHMQQTIFQEYIKITLIAFFNLFKVSSIALITLALESKFLWHTLYKKRGMFAPEFSILFNFPTVLGKFPPPQQAVKCSTKIKEVLGFSLYQKYFLFFSNNYNFFFSFYFLIGSGLPVLSTVTDKS